MTKEGVLTITDLKRHIKKQLRRIKQGKAEGFNFLGFVEDKELSPEVKSYFTFYTAGGAEVYDWVNGNKKLKELVEIIKGINEIEEERRREIDEGLIKLKKDARKYKTPQEWIRYIDAQEPDVITNENLGELQKIIRPIHEGMKSIMTKRELYDWRWGRMSWQRERRIKERYLTELWYKATRR